MPFPPPIRVTAWFGPSSFTSIVTLQKSSKTLSRAIDFAASATYNDIAVDLLCSLKFYSYLCNRDLMFVQPFGQA